MSITDINFDIINLSLTNKHFYNMFVSNKKYISLKKKVKNIDDIKY